LRFLDRGVALLHGSKTRYAMPLYRTFDEARGQQFTREGFEVGSGCIVSARHGESVVHCHEPAVENARFGLIA
jgi:hypothetical protein